jgi:hypothetical protein
LIIIRCHCEGNIRFLWLRYGGMYYVSFGREWMPETNDDYNRLMANVVYQGTEEFNESHNFWHDVNLQHQQNDSEDESDPESDPETMRVMRA